MGSLPHGLLARDLLVLYCMSAVTLAYEDTQLYEHVRIVIFVFCKTNTALALGEKDMIPRLKTYEDLIEESAMGIH